MGNQVLSSNLTTVYMLRKLCEQKEANGEFWFKGNIWIQKSVTTVPFPAWFNNSPNLLETSDWFFIHLIFANEE